MAVARAARRLAFVLFAAVLATLVTAGFPHGGDVTESKDSAPAVESSVVHAITPARVTGRLAADPSLLKVQSPAEFALQPNSGPAPALMRLGAQDVDVPCVSRDAKLPVAGDRAPPARQADL